MVLSIACECTKAAARVCPAKFQEPHKGTIAKSNLRQLCIVYGRQSNGSRVVTEYPLSESLPEGSKGARESF